MLIPLTQRYCAAETARHEVSLKLAFLAISAILATIPGSAVGKVVAVVLSLACNGVSWHVLLDYAPHYRKSVNIWRTISPALLFGGSLIYGYTVFKKMSALETEIASVFTIPVTITAAALTVFQRFRRANRILKKAKNDPDYDLSKVSVSDICVMCRFWMHDTSVGSIALAQRLYMQALKVFSR